MLVVTESNVVYSIDERPNSKRQRVYLPRLQEFESILRTLQATNLLNLS